MSKVKSYRSSKMLAREGALAGEGAFAVAPIAKGEIVWIRSGRILTVAEGKQLDERLLGFSIQIQDNFLLCACDEEEVTDFIIHFNHSCSPNIGISGEVTYVAMRDIEEGEELVVDYAMFITRKFRLNCLCKMPECRGVITGEDWRRPELIEKYGNYFAFYIQQKHAEIKRLGV
ncbi:SET domain-containing protein-lysine N-methyltransferase [Oligoflexia bacterium]|nr:SET domain-containing protein-lysine N-methyltransferase [Oligoflexia bacterium]